MRESRGATMDLSRGKNTCPPWEWPESWRSKRPVWALTSARSGSWARRMAAPPSGSSSKVVQLAITWTLANPAVDVAIAGARTPDQIGGSPSAAQFELYEEDLREMENIMQGAVAVGGPSPEGV